jgi:tetratricopeptide (TPR) repeat protein
MKILSGLAFASIAVALVSAQILAAQSVVEQAREMVKQQQLDRANELLSETVARDPSNEDALLELGDVQLVQGLNTDALKSFEAVLTNDPKSTLARAGEVKAAECEALADRNAGIDDSALLVLLRARKFVPDSPRLLFDFGMQAERMRIYADADEALTQAYHLAPDDLKILYALGRVELDEQKMAEAEEHLRAYLKVRPNDATAHYGLGHLLHMLTRDEDAKAELQKSIELQPQQTSSYYELGEIAVEMNDFDLAKQQYASVLKNAPRHGGAITGMGIVALRAKDYQTAEKYLKSAVEYAPDYATAHHYYALVLARLGRQAESKREADLAEELNRKDVKERRGNVMTVVQ